VSSGTLTLTHHFAGALLPPLDGEYKFLQIYFLGNFENEVNQRWQLGEK
jgi:hypothetical protein